MGIKTDKGIYLGCESLVFDDYTLTNYDYSKIFSVGEIVFGVSGSCRISQSIEYNLYIPERGEFETDEEFLIKKLSNSLRLTLREFGCLNQINPTIDIMDNCNLILVYRNEIYLVTDNFSILKPQKEELCIGNREYDKQSKFLNSESSELSSEEKIKLTIHNAINNTKNSHSDVNVIFIPGGDEISNEINYINDNFKQLKLFN